MKTGSARPASSVRPPTPPPGGGGMMGGGHERDGRHHPSAKTEHVQGGAFGPPCTSVGALPGLEGA
jgi:hypothetical protein